MKLTEKMSYLQGLLDGLQVDTSTKEGKAVERHAMSQKSPKTKKAEKTRENTEKAQFYVEFHAKLGEKMQKIA